MSQIIVCLKKYAKDSRMVYYFWSEFELQIIHTLMANISQNTLHGGRGSEYLGPCDISGFLF